MLNVRFRPRPKWERKPALQYRSAQFKTAYNRTLDKLEYEIGLLKGHDIHVEAGYTLQQLRNDRFPRGGHAPAHPGVVLYFESKGRSLCFPCGTYNRMESNLHAIALTLECLRAVDRYGVTVGDEQYRGFAAIAAPQTQMSVETAAGFINHLIPNFGSSDIIETEVCYRSAYKQAAARVHPDVTGGESERFLKLQQAKAVLDGHHARTKGSHQ